MDRNRVNELIRSIRHKLIAIEEELANRPPDVANPDERQPESTDKSLSSWTLQRELNATPQRALPEIDQVSQLKIALTDARHQLESVRDFQAMASNERLIQEAQGFRFDPTLATYGEAVRKIRKAYHLTPGLGSKGKRLTQLMLAERLGSATDDREPVTTRLAAQFWISKIERGLTWPSSDQLKHFHREIGAKPGEEAWLSRKCEKEADDDEKKRATNKQRRRARG